jgi:polysaccharide deacetylase 2 family uncharacterized protein YibQ
MPPARKKKKSPSRRTGKRLLATLLLALLVGSTVLATFYFIFIGPRNSGPNAERRKHLAYEQSPAIGEFSLPAVKRKPQALSAPSSKAVHAKPAYVVILIDDMGYQKRLGRQFLSLNMPLSFSFLPHAPFTNLLVVEAQKKHKAILLHLPLEPHDPTWELGPGALRTGMTDREIKRLFEQDLAAVSYAIGVNNHMGSKFTEDRKAMTSLLSQLKNHRLFFLDSLTSSKSIGFELAETMGLTAARRNIFLDNKEEVNAILIQLKALTALAQKHGSAIGIAHPKGATLEALKRFAGRIPADIKMVGIDRLIL